jgi:hypothetical protein
MRYMNIDDQKTYNAWMRRLAVVYGTFVLLIAAGVATLAVTNAPTATSKVVATASNQ